MKNITLAEDLKHLLGWSTALSVLMILAGLLAIFVPLIGGIAVYGLVSWLIIFSGAAHLLFAWHARHDGGFMWEMLVGILYIFVGVIMLTHPAAGLASMTLFLALYLFGKGVLEVISSFSHSISGQGWLLLDGIITLILAIMIWRAWPSSSEWVIGTLVGISLVFSGITRLLLSMSVHSVITKVA